MRSARANGSTGVAMEPDGSITGVREAAAACGGLAAGFAVAGAAAAARGATGVAVTSAGSESTLCGAFFGDGGGGFTGCAHAEMSRRPAISDRCTNTTACSGGNCDCPR
jgi:hypothetical protein